MSINTHLTHQPNAVTFPYLFSQKLTSLCPIFPLEISHIHIDNCKSGDRSHQSCRSRRNIREIALHFVKHLIYLMISFIWLNLVHHLRTADLIVVSWHHQLRTPNQFNAYVDSIALTCFQWGMLSIDSMYREISYVQMHQLALSAWCNNLKNLVSEADIGNPQIWDFSFLC